MILVQNYPFLVASAQSHNKSLIYQAYSRQSGNYVTLTSTKNNYYAPD